MIDLAIERMALRVAGLDEADGRRLALRVAARLAETATAGGSGGDRLVIRLTGRPGESIDALADRIAEQLARELVRTS